MALVFYVFIGYGILVSMFVLVKSVFRSDIKKVTGDLPNVTMFIAAYNEKDYAEAKTRNCFDLDYPVEKLEIIWVTDGSDDGTDQILKQIKGITVLHEPERNGKIAAMNRGMAFVHSPIVIFSDANTFLNREAVRNIVQAFQDPHVGCVSGEKRISGKTKDNAAGTGEGLYWKYESFLKKNDALLYSAVGAAGELFAIRTELFKEVEKDTLLDDFMISMRIVASGYKIAYTPDAFATETASASVKDEMKRKIRISAGGIQSVVRLRQLLNPFRYFVFSWQFISRKVLRWLFVPFALPALFAINFIILIDKGFYQHGIYQVIMSLQVLFYLMAIFGWILRDSKISFKILFLPYYIFIMNYAVFPGLIRYFRGKQSVNWERAKRAS